MEFVSKQTTRQSSKQNRPANKQASPASNAQGRSTSKSVTRQSVREERRIEQQLRREEEKRRNARARRTTIISVVAAFIAVVIIGAFFIINANSNAQSQTETIANPSYPPVDNIYCDTLEQTAFHIHAHVSIYINGTLSPVPQGVGIAPDGSCYYWLHTHNTDGIIHMEAPSNHSFILGNFLDIWSTHFTKLGYPSQLDVTDGWKAWVDGKPYTGDFRNIPLSAHTLITLAYQSPNVKPDTTYNWPQGL